jgi:hypothetical protein
MRRSLDEERNEPSGKESGTLESSVRPFLNAQ